MSWTDDIRCLYCDGRLPLYKKITDGQFCSATHRKAYWQEHERLAVERLLKTHDSLRAYRPPGAAEAILGTEPAPLPSEKSLPLSNYVSFPLTPLSGSLPGILTGDPVEYETVLEAEPPAWNPRVTALAEIVPAGTVRFAGPNCPRWIADRPGDPSPEPFARRATSALPSLPAVQQEFVCAFAGLMALPLAAKPAVSAALAADRVIAAEWRTHLVYDIDLRLLPIAEEAPAAPEEVPRVETMLALPAPATRDAAFVRMDSEAESAFLSNPETQFPTMIARLSTAILTAHLAPLPVYSAGLNYENLAAVNVEAGALNAGAEVPHLVPSIPVHRPRLLLTVAKRPAPKPAAAPAPVQTAPIPKPKVMAAAVSAPARLPAVGETTPVPAPSGLLPLTPVATTANATISQFAPTLPQPLQTELMRPMSKLEPIEERSEASLVSPPVIAAAAAEPGAPRVHPWTHAVDFWKHAPRDLKTLVFAIPVLLGLALHPTLPKVRVTAPSTGGIQRNFQHAWNAQLVSMRQSMVERAAVALNDDFRSGLDEWSSRGDATTEWSFDATGFVRPGPLAIYRPSIGLSDYQMQFLGMLDKKALSWVVRAADFDNYYVVKLVVLKPGPVPTMGLIRYAVIHGKPDSRVDTPVPVDARNDTLYRVRLDVHGDNFVLAVQGQMIDSWSEPRLRHGGVGFFTARDEASRVRWLQVTHQYDMLGRLCAYLAPYNVATTNGSLSQ